MGLEVPSDVVTLCRTLRERGYEVWVVGGAVRDLLRGRAAQDYDLATSATPAEVTQVFGRKRTIPTGEQHGTVTVLTERQGQRQQVEVTTYRGEGTYSDGRRPDRVVYVGSIEEDLKRRDFTMNAIAWDPLERRLVDPYGGQEDLAAGRIRAVGEPLERFSEDGLRAMRAVRFAAQLEFAIDSPTAAAIPQAIEVFRRVSVERVRDELIKILMSRQPSIGLALMRTTGLLSATIPELCEGVGLHQNRFHQHDVWEHTLATVDGTSLLGDPPWLVRMAALLHDVAKPRTAQPKEGAPGEHTFFRHEVLGASMAEAICRRLKLSTKEREAIVNLVGQHMFWYSSEWTDGTVRRFMSRVGVEELPRLFALREGDVRGRGRGEDPGGELDALKARIAAELERASALKVGDLLVGGADVIELLGVRPGPLVGEVLRRLLERVLDDTTLNERERLRALIPEVAREVSGRGG